MTPNSSSLYDAVVDFVGKHPDIQENYFFGSRPAAGCLRNKYYVCYHQDSGFSIRNFNALQILIRDILNHIGLSFLGVYQNSYKREVKKGFNVNSQPSSLSQNAKVNKIYRDILKQIGVQSPTTSEQLNTTPEPPTDPVPDSIPVPVSEPVPVIDQYDHQQHVPIKDIRPPEGTYWFDRKEFAKSNPIDQAFLKWLKKPTESLEHFYTLITLYPPREKIMGTSMKKAVRKILFQDPQFYDVVKKLEEERDIAVFIQLLKNRNNKKKNNAMIHALWKREAYLATNEQTPAIKKATKQRLVFEFHYINEKQLTCSMQCQEFWKLIGLHPDAAAEGFRPEQLKVIASHIGNDDKGYRPFLLSEVVVELEHTDPDTKAKLEAIAPYAKKWNLLEFPLEFKLWMVEVFQSKQRSN